MKRKKYGSVNGPIVVDDESDNEGVQRSTADGKGAIIIDDTDRCACTCVW